MSYKIANSRVRDAVLKGIPESGPPTLKSRWARSRYRSPLGLNSAFDEAMKVIGEESQQLQKQASSESDPAKKEKLDALSHRHNPEVKFNHLVQSAEVDLKQPIYKLLAQRQWQQKKQLILMQRLEQHRVIPDTMPTLDPLADVDVRFLTPNMRYLEPGMFVANDVSSRLPQIEIRDFSTPAGSSAKYTVLIVNPDMPDLEHDSYSNWLHFAATDVEVSLAKPSADFHSSTTKIAVPYIPPHPEKNGPTQRLCVWVFRQSGHMDVKSDLSREFFNIREFARKHQLTPVGASLWRSKWDVTSPAVREKYGLDKGNVYFRARTAKPENALLHVRERPKWMKVDGLE